MGKSIGLVKSKFPALIVIDKTVNNEEFLSSIINSKKRIFFLNKPLKCKIIKEDDSWIATNNDLEIEVFEPTKQKVIDEFAEAFNELYEIFGLSNDESLSNGAIKIKNKINKYINETFCK